MHDTTDLENRGLVTVFVASSEFGEAARVQAQALGFDAPRVFVPHPIQDRRDDEMRALADAACAAVIAALTE